MGTAAFRLASNLIPHAPYLTPRLRQRCPIAIENASVILKALCVKFFAFAFRRGVAPCRGLTSNPIPQPAFNSRNSLILAFDFCF